MLEDQSEERAALYALGLLEGEDLRRAERDRERDPALRERVAEVEETLANLLLSVTAHQTPAADLRSRVLDRVAGEPPRVTTDREGRVETINPAFTQLCGYEFSELRGQKPGHMLQGAETDPAAVSALREAIANARNCEVEMVNYHKDGSPYRVRVSIEPRRDEHGAVVGFQAVARKLA